jgi:hypothetical protein
VVHLWKKLESAIIEFTDWKWLPKRINIEMSWKKPQSYEVDIEAGVDQSLE